MVDMDVAYAATWSIRRDVELLLRTVATVVIRRAPY
jgi:lipopolysaccharide/colanic/teichoic acid biosynthesis glycosyltransferase